MDVLGARGAVRAVVAGVVLGLLCSGGVTTAHAEETAPGPLVVEVSGATTTPVVGISADKHGIADAALDVVRDDEPANVVALVDAASAVGALPMQETDEGLSVSTTAGTTTVLNRDGVAEATHAELPAVGIEVRGDTSEASAVDDAMVWEEVAPSTDVVARATETGMQLVAVLADETAPSTIAFDLVLPEGGHLVEAEDGSIDIVAPVEIEKIDEASLADLERRASLILDGNFDETTGELTASQEAALAALPDLKTYTVEEERAVATIAPAWAVDANGEPVGTRYELDGATLTQVVDVTATTAFPVTADPSFWWYFRKAAECIASVAATVVVAAKIAQITVKLFRLLRAAKPGTALNRAYQGWMKLGSNNDQRLGNLGLNLRLIAGLYQQYGSRRATQIIIARGGRIKAARDFIVYGASTIASVTGLDSCVSLVTGRNY